eukprot:8311899-Alexandrium_andersonii.AAC.1
MRRIPELWLVVCPSEVLTSGTSEAARGLSLGCRNQCPPALPELPARSRQRGKRAASEAGACASVTGKS